MRNEIGTRTKILAGALDGHATKYLDDLYAAGMRGMDGISIHPYSLTSSGWKDPRPGDSQFRRAIEDIHKVSKRNGGNGDLFLTEFGFAVRPAQPHAVSARRQARWLAHSFRVANEYSYVKAATLFAIRDIGDDTAWDHRCGVLRYDFSARPSFAKVRGTLKDLA